MSKFGQYHVAESPSSLLRLHFHQGGPLQAVDHEPRVDVLDQEDLIAQGIDTAALVPGAKTVDALGSCTAQATTAAISNTMDEDAFCATTGAASYTDTKVAEEWAITFYHRCTDQTGDPSQEWPPTDCGSSGPFVVQELEKLNLATGDQIAHGAENIVSLMQADGLLVGQPFLNAWMEPDAHGFIDGDGTIAQLERDIQGGVAGGHETYWSAIEHLALTETGGIDVLNTVIRFRNSWSKSWGDNGSARLHLSTYMALAAYCDWRQLVG